MGDSFEYVQRTTRDLAEYLELAKDVFLGDRHAALDFEAPPPFGEHFHIECPLCLRGVCVFLHWDDEGGVDTCGAALFDEGMPCLCGPNEGESKIVAWFRES